MPRTYADADTVSPPDADTFLTALPSNAIKTSTIASSNSVGKTCGGRAATVAKKRSLPSEYVAAKYEKLAVCIGCIAKRIVFIEAHCGRTDIRIQGKLTNVPAPVLTSCPPMLIPALLSSHRPCC